MDHGDSGSDEGIYRLSSMDKGDEFRIYIQDQSSGLYREPESGSPASTKSFIAPLDLDIIVCKVTKLIMECVLHPQ